MNAKKIVAYICPSCSTRYINEEEAIDCCSFIESEDAWQCGNCEEIYDDKKDAIQCCKKRR